MTKFDKYPIPEEGGSKRKSLKIAKIFELLGKKKKRKVSWRGFNKKHT